MSLLQAVVLGAVQGLTEFVPISSSGHLVIVPEALGWDAPSLAFDVLLHAASLLALVAYFGRDLWGLAKGTVRGDTRSRRLVGLLALATVPAGLAGFFLEGFFEGAFDDARRAALSLAITAAILIAGEALARRAGTADVRRGKDAEEVPAAGAVGIGLAQAAAILPGISRSGATIATGLALGLGRAEAARFSFLLAIPAIFGASVLEIPELAQGSVGLGAGTAGFVASGISSYAAIAILLRYLRTRTLYPFALYCVVAAVVFYLVL